MSDIFEYLVRGVLIGVTYGLLADITIIVAIYALTALSVGIPYGMCGPLSVAQASLAAIGAYLSAILTNSQGWSPWATLPVAILVPACFAYPFARIVTRLSPLALVIATLMFGYLLDGLLREGGSLTGGYIGLSGIPQIPGAKTPQMYYLISWGLVIVGLIFYARLRASHIGLILRTIRSDSLRAATDGVNVAHFRSLAMALAQPWSVQQDGSMRTICPTSAPTHWAQVIR